MRISFEVPAHLLMGSPVAYLNRNSAVMEPKRQHKVAHEYQAGRSKDTFGLASRVDHSEIVPRACVGTVGH